MEAWIALALAPRTLRLTHLQARLPGTSTGVLDPHVHHMTTLGLLSRQRFREIAPRVEIQLTDAGRELVPIAGALARWRVRRASSLPEDHEQVDAAALVRLLPVLSAEETILSEGLPTSL